jgi:2,5-diamino-6-(ribosylamino)-4(3H)-pyrimidinone 5'-phosphate reductase
MKPYIICHMLSSVDGKTDGDALEAVTGEGEYEATGAKLEGDAWICGRTTMLHFAEDAPFVSASIAPAGPQPVFVARTASSGHWRGGLSLGRPHESPGKSLHAP